MYIFSLCLCTYKNIKNCKYGQICKVTPQTKCCVANDINTLLAAVFSFTSQAQILHLLLPPSIFSDETGGLMMSFIQQQ